MNYFSTSESNWKKYVDYLSTGFALPKKKKDLKVQTWDCAKRTSKGGLKVAKSLRSVSRFLDRF